MPVERTSGGTTTSVVDVLDRVLDKGIVIDAWIRVSVVGIDLITVEARVVVASIGTYLQNSDALAQVSAASKPALFGDTPKSRLAETSTSSSLGVLPSAVAAARSRPPALS